MTPNPDVCQREVASKIVPPRTDVDYVIVYRRSRMHRNTIDAAITKRDLRAAGAVVISVTDYIEDTPIGDLVGSVLDAVNEDQSRAPARTSPSRWARRSSTVAP